ncbi:hypothetical protein D9611_010018 [Ephemerocybe angulata]|uniref:WSC domain-containing protein n=1 Tax=Ephemerocybe angulata TaxID=980116 RepID=A0A8H5FF59_9AGAR|nr:hypothetical protein D9611_010018 [Tulosesus angulatus]
MAVRSVLPLLLGIFLAASPLLPTCAARSHSLRSPHHARHAHGTSPNLVNGTLPWGSEPQLLEKRAGEKYVFMHHIVGNTYVRLPSRLSYRVSDIDGLECRYPYTPTDWENDLREIAAKGVDAIALNIGSADWQRTQVQAAFDAAKRINTPVKLFFSFDFTEMPCDLGDIVSRINTFAGYPNQFKVGGRTFVSSYAGDCLGNGGWASLKAQTGNAYVMPFIWGLEGQFGNWNALDSWYCWGCAYPQGNYDKNTDDDKFYMSQLGSRYATTVSAWQFTHFSYKNWYLRGDNWLLNNRWEQLMSMRNDLTFVEMLTWNDFGEANYFGPIRGAQPSGTYWADNFPHTAWFDMSEYYIRAFKSGSYPAITKDVIYYWSKPHPAGAIASGDSIGRGNGFDWAMDNLWAVAFATSPAQVTLKLGGSSKTFDVPAGVSKLTIPASPGRITVQMVRNGQTVINETPAGFEYVQNPVRYNLNAYVGSAIGAAKVETTTTTSTTLTTSTTSATSTTTTTTSSTTTTTAPTATTTTVSGSTWTFQGCFEDRSDQRILDGLFTSAGSNTVSQCLASCASAGFAYGGVEYGRECFCGASPRAGAAVKPASDCAMPCAGNSAELCGSGNRLGLYSRPPSTSTTTTSTAAPTTTSVGGATWTYRGCFVDPGDKRVLYDGGFTSVLTNTIPQCLSTCLSKGYAFAGVEYGRECYCGTEVRAGAQGSAEGQCSQACAGDSSQLCGGGNRIGVYSRALTGTTSTTTTTTSTISTTTSTTSTSTTSTATGAAVTVTAFNPKGCIAEGTTGTRRALTGPSYTRGDLTPQVCNSLCASYNYAGVENGNECYCGNNISNNGATGNILPASSCSVACTGDASQKCGGSWTLNLSVKAPTVFTAQGCFADGGDRMLRGYSTSRSGMTNEMCVGICVERGFGMAATQNGGECFCGNEIWKTGGVGVGVASSECGMKCSGNSAQNCGSAWRNSLFIRA